MKKLPFPMIAILIGVTAMAGESVSLGKLTEKSLPPEVYSKLSSGKQLTYLWRAPEFKPERGFKVGKVEWQADSLLASVHVALCDRVPTLSTHKGSHYTLELAVTEASEDRGGFWTTFKQKHGYFILEGRVLDPDGSLVGAFVTKEEDQLGGYDNIPTFAPGVERALSGIARELFRR